MAANLGAETVKVEWLGPEGRVLCLTLHNPPLNAVTPGLRHALLDALAEHAPQAKAVVITAEGRHFSASTGLDGFGLEQSGAPDLAALALAIETLPVPVVVALDGMVLGDGAELALAAHARVAGSQFRFALPGVSLGLCPQGGASQRLPRLIGAKESLALLLNAKVLSVDEALAIGLIDHWAEAADPASLRQAAVDYALAMPGPRPTADRRDGLGDVAGYGQALSQARAQAARNALPAPLRIVECLEAALILPIENGLALEAVAFEDLAASPEAAGLIAAARAERRVNKLPLAIARLEPPSLATIGLVGADTTQAEMAALALRHGLRVLWYDPVSSRLNLAMDQVFDLQNEAIAAGALTSAACEAERSRLHVVAVPDDLSAVALLVLGQAADCLSADEYSALAATNPAQARLATSPAPGQIGYEILPKVRAAELALPAAAQALHAAQAVQLIRCLNVTPVVMGPKLGAARQVFQAGKEALVWLFAQGVPRAQLARALDGFGQPLPDLSEAGGAHAMGEEEIRRRWLGAMANAGLHLLEEGVVRRPSDIDYLMVSGYGFPRWRGGPMHQANLRGMMVLRADLRRWQAAAAESEQAQKLWTPAPLIDRLIAEGRRLEDLDQS